MTNPVTLDDLREDIAEAILESLDADWRCADGARAVIENVPLVRHAPELLEAAQHFVRWAEDPADSPLGMARELEWIEQARAAIAKATGQQLIEGKW